MGRLPPQPVPPGRPGVDLPGRLRRASRRRRLHRLDDRSELGRLGEDLACWFLDRHGVAVLATNVPVGRGEIDILARDGRMRVAVEVRTRRGLDDPVDGADPAKREQARRLGHAVGAVRIDVIGIGIGPDGVDVHWVPDAG